MDACATVYICRTQGREIEFRGQDWAYRFFSKNNIWKEADISLQSREIFRGLKLKLQQPWRGAEVPPALIVHLHQKFQCLQEQ